MPPESTVRCVRGPEPEAPEMSKLIPLISWLSVLGFQNEFWSVTSTASLSTVKVAVALTPPPEGVEPAGVTRASDAFTEPANAHAVIIAAVTAVSRLVILPIPVWRSLYNGREVSIRKRRKFQVL